MSRFQIIIDALISVHACAIATLKCLTIDRQDMGLHAFKVDSEDADQI